VQSLFPHGCCKILLRELRCCKFFVVVVVCGLGSRADASSSFHCSCWRWKHGSPTSRKGLVEKGPPWQYGGSCDLTHSKP